jgi:pyrimidine-specific ribonucleoside hydrolase
MKNLPSVKRFIASIWLILFITNVWSQPRPEKLSSSVIIDTDCGFDDMRAISLLLAQPEITVKAILTSDGSLPPKEGSEKVLSLLNEFEKSNIPVACGEVEKSINPAWRPFCRNISWGSQSNGQLTNINAADLLLKVLNSESEKITLVCLGSLTNIYEAIRKDPTVLKKVDRIIWYNDAVKPLEGFNYECDKESANSVLKSGLRVDVISNLNFENALFDTSLADLCAKSDTKLAHVLGNVFSQQIVNEKLKENHYKLCDDLLVLYLTNPELFGINTDIDKLYVRYNTDYNLNGIKEAISDMIKGIYETERNVVFNKFPVQRELFNYDVRPIIDSAIARYGYEEWKANVMTDEFHGHLGVFSIVGAKMGIKAREIFGVEPDMLEVITYAGTKPPYSCLTDGIQVSTGATLGMGTIRLAQDSEVQPSAIFTYKNQSVRITLKKEYLEKVDADINEGIVKFGLMDDGYWKLVRRNALKYWLEWDRNKIFDIVEIRQ